MSTVPLSLLLRLALPLGLVGLVGVTVPAVAQAQDDATVAEQRRIEAEMRRLAQRNAWAGVERSYLQLRQLRGIEISFEFHHMGAQAAQFMGKTWEMYQRLERAAAIDPQEEVLHTMEGINSRYGRVEIKGHPRRRPELSVSVMPFAPDERKSIEYAQEVVVGAGSFTGMLPRGEYTVGQTTFTVEPGSEEFLVIEVGRDAGVTDDGLIIYAGPVAVIGYSFAGSPMPGAVDDVGRVQPRSVSGSGTTLELGAEVGFTREFGVAGTVGYRGMYGSDNFHGITGWLAGAWRPGDLRVAGGPTYGMVFGRGFGVADWFDIDHDPRRYPNVNLEYRGHALLGGFQVSAGYGLLDFEPFQGVVELGGAWQTDGTRHYLGLGLRIGLVPKVPRFRA